MKKRTIYFDYLRVIATFAVVFLHSSAQKWHSVDVNTLTWKVFASYDSLVRWCVPVFVMISGALFLEREYDIKKIYSKYVLRMATAFVFWSILYALVKGGSKSVIVSNMITGHYHMWFIPMICGIYICIPFIYKFVQDENLTKYFLILSFAFAFVFPMSLRLLSDFGSETANILYTPLNTFLNNVWMRFVMGYTGYFVAGYFLNRTELSKKCRYIIYFLGIAAALFTIFATIHVSVKTQSRVGYYFGNFTVNVMLESLAVFVWVKYNAHLFKKLDRIVTKISAYCFGVYLVHPLIMEQVNYKLGFNTLSFNPVLSVPVICILAFSISLAISAVINKIPVIKKYIV